ncbi:hypothetical protein QJS66_09300 [Kocuria rhizophila]|nr:hypothetical protein QJS66_09300 [Kocuria rhizophila]
MDKRVNTASSRRREDVRRAQPQWHRVSYSTTSRRPWAMLKLGGPAMLRETKSVVLLTAGFGAVRGGKKSGPRRVKSCAASPRSCCCGPSDAGSRPQWRSPR